MAKKDVQMSDIIEAALELARLAADDPGLCFEERG